MCFSNRTTSIRVFTNGVVIIWTQHSHGDDFLVCGLTSNLVVLADEFKNNFLVKNAEIVSLKPEHQNEIHLLKRRISVDNFGWHVELDQRYVKSLLDAMETNHGKSMATPGSKGQESSRNMADVTEKLDPQEHREFRSGAGICQKMTEQRFVIAFSTKEIMREAARTLPQPQRQN